MKMRLFLVVCAMLCACYSVYAHKTVIPVSVVVRQGQTVFGDNALSLLKSKMKTAMSANGIISDGYSGIVVCPSVNVTGKNVIEGGMRNIIVYDFQLTLTMFHVISGVEFGSVAVSLRGEGYSEKEACISALMKINTSDKRLSDFLVMGCKRVEDYYNDNTSLLITMAQTKSRMKQYEEAIALLLSYPASLPGYDRIAKEMTVIYAKWQSDICEQLIQKARNAYAKGDYELAVEFLNNVDMQSSCAEEARKISSDIKNSVDKERAENMRLYNKMIDTAADIEKQKMKSLENVAKAYYQNQRNYVYLI